MLTTVLDDHVPLKSEVVKVVPIAPWFDFQYETLRKLRRKAEKRYKRTNLHEHKDRYKNLRKQATELACEKKSQYYADNSFNSFNELLDKYQDVIPPDSNDNNELTNDFMNVFAEKIDIQPFDAPTQDSIYNKSTSFQRATRDKIQQIVLSYGI